MAFISPNNKRNSIVAFIMKVLWNWMIKWLNGFPNSFTRLWPNIESPWHSYYEKMLCLTFGFIWFLLIFTHGKLWANKLLHLRCCKLNSARQLSQPHFGQVWGWSPTLGKVGGWESSGTPECSELDSRGQNTSH
jgi:hypothetical protein